MKHIETSRYQLSPSCAPNQKADVTTEAQEISDTLLHIARHDRWLCQHLQQRLKVAQEQQHPWHMAIAISMVATICQHSREQKRAWVKARLRGQEAIEEWPWYWIRVRADVYQDELSRYMSEAIRQLKSVLDESQQIPSVDSPEGTKLCLLLLHLRADIEGILWMWQQEQPCGQMLRKRLEAMDAMAIQWLAQMGIGPDAWTDDERLSRLHQQALHPWQTKMATITELST